jgi:hypothetical protein
MRFLAAQVTLQRLGPDAERRRLPQRMGASTQGQSALAVPGEELGRQPTLPYPRITKQEYNTKLPGRGSPLRFQFRKLAAATHQPNIPRAPPRGRCAALHSLRLAWRGKEPKLVSRQRDPGV